MEMIFIFPLIFIAGFVDSIAGGGGLISLTAYYAVGLPPTMALGTNKFSSSAGTFVATMRFIRSKNVCWSSAGVAVAGAMIGSWGGVNLALLVDERYLKMVMVVGVPLIALFTVFKKDFGAPKKEISSKKMLLLSLLVGLGVGCYDGFFGPGAGTFYTLAFTAVIGLDVVTACGNTKVVNLASNLVALVIFILNGSVNYKIAIPAALCGIAGSYLGAGLAIKKGANIVRPMLLVVVGLLLVKVIAGLF